MRHLFQIIRQQHFVLVAQHKIHTRKMLQGVEPGLRIASRHRDKRLRRVAQRPANDPSTIGLGILRHGAGIQDEQIGCLSIGHLLVAHSREPVRQDSGLRLIETTSGRVKCDFFLHESRVSVKEPHYREPPSSPQPPTVSAPIPRDVAGVCVYPLIDRIRG